MTIIGTIAIAVACPFNTMLQVTFFGFIRIAPLANTRARTNIMKFSGTTGLGTEIHEDLRKLEEKIVSNR